MRKKAFTLIELLVVIAIIGVLISILLPALKKAKYHARMLLDKTNLKTLASAMRIYLSQNDEKFFPYPTGDNVLWISQISDNVDNIEEVRLCPETTARVEDVIRKYETSPGGKWGSSLEPWLWADSSVVTKSYEMGSYGFNGWLYGDANQWVPATMKTYPYTSITDVRMTSSTPLFMDGNWVDAWPTNTNTLPASSAMPASSQYATYYDLGDTSDGTTSTSIGRFVINRHGRETNSAFLDMHVETITLEQLWTLSWHKGSRPNYSPTLPSPRPRDK